MPRTYFSCWRVSIAPGRTCAHPPDRGRRLRSAEFGQKPRRDHTGASKPRTRVANSLGQEITREQASVQQFRPSGSVIPLTGADSLLMIDRAPGQDRGSGREPIAQDLCGRITKTIGRDLRRLSKVGHIERSQAAGLADRRLDHSGDSPTQAG